MDGLFDEPSARAVNSPPPSCYQLSTVENFIEHDIASGFLYRPIAEQMKDVTVLSCSPPLFIQSSLVWKEGFQKYAPMKQFIRYIQRSVFDGII